MSISLKELESVFGKESEYLLPQVKEDMKEIRRTISKEYGFFKARKVTDQEILKAFVIFREMKMINLVKPTASNYWDEFFTRCAVNGDVRYLI